jgi:hypothetical protein
LRAQVPDARLIDLYRAVSFIALFAEAVPVLLPAGKLTLGLLQLRG